MYRKLGKRIFDVIFALVAFFILLPVLIIISLFIKVDSQGPVFFLQERIGEGGKIFSLIKFRSMYKDDFQENKEFTPGDTSRITRLGKILRKTKIDELPQIINVLMGDMSLVGPRPEVPKYRHVYEGSFETLLNLRPGITGPGSIKYRNEEDILNASLNPTGLYESEILPDKLRLALEYKKKVTFQSDVKILCSTFVRIFN